MLVSTLAQANQPKELFSLKKPEEIKDRQSTKRINYYKMKWKTNLLRERGFIECIVIKKDLQS